MIYDFNVFQPYTLDIIYKMATENAFTSCDPESEPFHQRYCTSVLIRLMNKQIKNQRIKYISSTLK